jgi:hypothetical protein
MRPSGSPTFTTISENYLSFQVPAEATHYEYIEQSQARDLFDLL